MSRFIGLRDRRFCVRRTGFGDPVVCVGARFAGD